MPRRKRSVAADPLATIKSPVVQQQRFGVVLPELNRKQPDSFVGLYHWCELHGTRIRRFVRGLHRRPSHVGLGVRHVENDAFYAARLRRVGLWFAPFHAAFVRHLHRLKADGVLKNPTGCATPAKASDELLTDSFPRWDRSDIDVDGIVHRAKRLCLSLAELSNELPTKEGECGRISWMTYADIPALVDLPLRPLRTVEDVQQWLSEMRHEITTTPEPRLDHVDALKYWSYVGQAAFWLESHGIAAPVFPDRQTAKAWYETRKGEKPTYIPALKALNELIQLCEQAASITGGKNTEPAAKENEAQTAEATGQGGTPVEPQAEKLTGGNDVGGGRAEANGKQTKGKRGRRRGSVASDPAFDKQVFERWAEGRGQFDSFEAVAVSFGLNRDEAWAAKERHRDRLRGKSGKKGTPKGCQGQ